jgi:hypothetical protein
VIALIASLSFAWTLATTYTDGKPLPITEISHTLVQWGTCDQGGKFQTLIGSAEVPAPATAWQADTPPATYCSQLFTVLVDGRQSAAAPAGPTIVHPGIDPDSPASADAVVVGRTVLKLRETPDGYLEIVDTGAVAPRGARCHLLRDMGIWGTYGYGVVGGDIVICRRD